MVRSSHSPMQTAISSATTMPMISRRTVCEAAIDTEWSAGRSFDSPAVRAVSNDCS